MILAFRYMKKNWTFFCRIGLNIFIISLFFLLSFVFIIDNKIYGENFVEDNLCYNYYEYDSSVYDYENILQYDYYSYHKSDKQLYLNSHFRVQDNDYVANISCGFLSFYNNKIPSSLNNFLKKDFIGQEINNDSEILISKEFAQYIAYIMDMQYYELLGKSISLEVDEKNHLLNNQIIVGIFSRNLLIEKDGFQEFSDVDVVVSDDSFNYEDSINRTRILFDSFNNHNVIEELDSSVHGTYYGLEYQKQLSTIENQNAFMSQIFMVFLLLLFGAVIINSIILIGLQMKKSRRFFSLLNILGVTKKRIVFASILGAVLFTSILLFLSLLLSVLLYRMLTPILFGREPSQFFSLDLLVSFMWIYISELCIFVGGIFINMKVMLKENFYKR